MVRAWQASVAAQGGNKVQRQFRLTLFRPKNSRKDSVQLQAAITTMPSTCMPSCLPLPP